MTLTPKNWDKFQHYKDRKPAWIKLHRDILDDYEYACLPLASRALAPLLWLLASEYEGGKITASEQEIAFRLRTTERELVAALRPLISKGFFIASEALADCKLGAIPEKERETELEGETDIRAVADATRPDEYFDDFWKAYPRRDGANPKDPARKKFIAAVKSGGDPQTIITGARRYRAECEAKQQIGTPYVAQAVTWLNQRRWGDYAPQAAVVATGPPPGAPSDAELRRKYGGQDGRDNRTDATATDNSDADAGDHARELLAEGRGADRGIVSDERPGHTGRNAGVRSLGEVFQATSALAALGTPRTGDG